MRAYLWTVLRRLGLLEQARRSWCAVLARAKGISVVRDAQAIRIRRKQDEIRIASSHGVYLGDMINFFDYYFSAVVPEEQGGYRVADYSQPKVHRLSGSQVAFEFPSLPESDESTEAYLTALQPKAGEVVLDLGSYAGASTYFFSKAVGPEGIVAAFEPDPTSRVSLERNVREHSLANVKIFPLGIWSEAKTMAFQSEGNMGSSVSEIVKRSSNTREVEMITLEEAARLAGASSVACVKMDIEGAEVAVLQAAGDFLQRHRPRLVIEPHLVEGRMSTEPIMAILRRAGYRVDVISQGKDWPLISATPQ
ncbi:MAG: FkbM family methyltransferase [Chthoniobacterales bacterium]